MQFICTNILDVFGLDWQSMLFYVVNFLLLITVLVLVLYKPVKKMINAKRKNLDDVYKENEKLRAESEKQNAEYEKKVADMKLENARVSAQVSAAAQEKADAIVAEAQEKAHTIVSAAKKEAAMQREQLKGEYRDSVNTLAVQIAEKVLEREVSEKDNADLIERVLSDWESD